MRNALILFAAAVLVLVIFFPSFTELQEIRSRNRALDKRIIEMAKKRAALLKEQKLLEDDPVYLEKVAREKMHLMREGEVVYRFTEEGQEKAKEGKSVTEVNRNK